MDAANGSACILIGRRGDGAGVENDDLSGGGCVRACQSLLVELALDGGAVGLSGAASEVLYVEAWHRNMLAQIGMARSECLWL